MIPVPQPVLESLSRTYGSTSNALQRFGGGGEESDGIVYSYPYNDKRRLLKIMAIPVENQATGRFCLEERLRFMRYLGEHGARIAYPQLSPQGNLYETYEYENHLWVGYSMEIAKGRTPAEKGWNLRLFQNWGQTIGRTHQLAQGYPSWQASVDPETDGEFLTWRGEWQGFYDWCQEDDVKEKWLEIKYQLEELPIRRDGFGFIHNDPHIWNLRVDGDQITLLDFDVANHHWFVNDIAIACQNILIFLSGGLNGTLRNRGKLLEFLQYFMEGYARENHLPEEWLNQLDLFISYRRILLFIVMYNWHKSKPSLHKTWKGLIFSPPELIGPTFSV
jgi:Ser/Thr protein kinase RdoA (MazF antagonist)